MENFREEMRYEYNLNPDSVVIDCGGYEGRWAAGIHERYGCTVHVLEPVRKFYEQIWVRLRDYPKILIWRFGVGAEYGDAEFSIKGDMTGKYANNPDKETVEIVSVDKLFDLEGEQPEMIDVLKLNIEGSEFDVVEKLIETGLINRVRNLQVQWHDVVPNAQARYNGLQKELARTHRLTFDHGWVWQSWEINK